jgi:methylated-DNA-[protein]-cysteine S-methyltransferase
MSNVTKFQFVVDSPIGALGIRTSRRRLNRVEFLDWHSKPFLSQDPFAVDISRQLECYFHASPFEFSIPINLNGTDFQKQVWQLLLMIKPGEVRTYGDIAQELNTSPRAVGSACRSNPTPLIVPCHRVVSADGIGGFAGNSQGRRVEVKRWLLKHEGVSL